MKLHSVNDVWEIVSILTSAIRVPEEYGRTDVGDVSGLAESMERFGLLAPVVVGMSDEGEFVLRAGLRRLRAAQMNRWQFLPVIVLDHMDDSPGEALSAFCDENTHRKPLTPSEAVRVADLIEANVRGVMAARMRAGVKAEPSGNLPQGSPSESREIAAQAVGMSASSLRSARKLLQLVESPDLASDVREQVQDKVEFMDSTGNVSRAWREARALVGPASEPSGLSGSSLRRVWARAGTATESFVKALDAATAALGRDFPGPGADINDEDLDTVEENAQRALEVVHRIRQALLQGGRG